MRGPVAFLGLWQRTVIDVVLAGLRERLLSGWGRKRWRRDRALADSVARDVRVSLRGIARNPGFALTVIALIALGVGATTMIFSVVDGVLLRPLPYPESGRLYRLMKAESGMPVPDYQDLREHITAFDAIGATWGGTRDLTSSGEPARLVAGQVTAEFLELLGATAWHGRLFTDDEYGPGASRVVVLEARLWLERFGGDPSVIGRSIVLNGEPTQVVGVMGPEFASPEALGDRRVQLYLPLDPNPPNGCAQQRDCYALGVVARLREGATPQQALSELGALAAQLAKQYPREWRTREGQARRFDMEMLVSATVGDIGQALWLFLGAVSLMLLIACANVANLFLARGTEREQEMAVRAALGASRGRLLAQVLTEGLLLAVLGGLGGLVVAYGGVAAFRVLDPGGIPRIAELTLDARIFAFTAVVSVLTGVLFAFLPAWTSSRATAGVSLRDGEMRATAARSRSRLRNILVVAELCLALVLLAGSAVMFHGFVRLRRVNPGFEPDRLLTIQLDAGTRVPPERRLAFADDVIERLRNVPRVRSAGLSWRLPFDRPGARCCMSTRASAGGGDTISVFLHPVTNDYVSALGARLIDGRDFSHGDRNVRPWVMGGDSAAPPAHVPVIVSRRIAERFWPGESAIGQSIQVVNSPMQLDVIGVIEPILHWGLHGGIGDDIGGIHAASGASPSDVYLPYAASISIGLGLLDIAIRHDGPPGPIATHARAVIGALEPDLPLDRIATMEERVSASIATPRFYAALITTFALLAFVLASAGVYGSMLYIVGLRRREVGIRLALGAESGDVVRLILARGAALVGAGTALGLGMAFAATRLLRGLVFEVSVTDPRTLGAAATLLALTGVLACWLPARRAGRIDPASMLRND